MIEWCASSYFSFLEGTTSPACLIGEAHAKGYQGLALGDRMGLYGLVEAERGRQNIIKATANRPFFAPGIRIHFDHADPLFVYPLHKKSYGDLCVLLSDWALEGLVEHEKGLPPLPWSRFRDFLRAQKEAHGELHPHFLFFSVSGRFYPWPDKHSSEFKRIQTQDRMRVAPSYSLPPTQEGQCPFWLLELSKLCESAHKNPELSALSLVWPLTLAPGIEKLQAWLFQQSLLLKVPLVASSLPLFCKKEDFELAQLLTAIRHRRVLNDLGLLGQVNSQRRLLSPKERAAHKEIWHDFLQTQSQTYPFENPFDRSTSLAQRHAFNLKELQYRYPAECVPPGENIHSYFHRLVMEGAHSRYPQGIPSETLQQISKELQLIRDLKFEDYFLTIYDILQYARSQKILFQGRGSAANSAVCYCLGITSIDPVQMNLLFERFLSAERHEAPDIDIDFEHERREEVIQEVYSRYGRHRSAMVANTIRFRGRMAVRETGKSLGLNDKELADIADVMGREGFRQLQADTTHKCLPDFIPPHVQRVLPQLLRLSQQLIGLPRHLGIHSCGFVLSNDDLRRQCVLEPARKEMRSVIPWNKDDVDYLNWVKVDLLSLGMLTALRKCFDLIGEQNITGQKLALHTIPHDCPQTYKAIRRADTVGVFQIESRAQMNMLPRLAPRNFYDLVIEVAIVRPGPIQGGMVHPYLRRRQGLEKWRYDHPKLEPILSKTLGVPIFQEQVMRMAVAIADFSPGEADQMRKVMSGAWRTRSEMHTLRDKLMRGMARNGVSKEFAERIYKQMEGFGEYGFPESHSASFAILTYASSWIKTHHPAAFLCALLNSQPMGFYSPRALVGDAKRHGVRALPSNIFYSRWLSRLEGKSPDSQTPSVRLGLHLIKSLSQDEAEVIESLQDKGLLEPSRENSIRLSDLRLHLKQSTLEKIISAGALSTKNEERPQQMWQVYPLRHQDKVQTDWIPTDATPPTQLLEWSEWESLLADYKTLGLSLRNHPALYARTHFFKQHRWNNAESLWKMPASRVVDVVGLLAVKQKPPTAGGMCFLTLEDESGFINLALKPKVYSAFRLIIDRAPLLAAQGRIERSPQIDTQDPHTSALSLNVIRIWNPFLEIRSSIPQVSRRRRHTQFVDR